jgi:hypothetical protein
MEMSLSPRLDSMATTGTKFNTARGNTESVENLIYRQNSRFAIIRSLNKIPKKIPKDKEALYEENISLKATINLLKEAIGKLETKIQFMHESNKRAETADVSQRNYKLLKQKIKDLEVKLNEKEDEAIELKKNIKISRVNELELEVKAYKEECIRLRYHLQDFIEGNNIERSALDLEKEIYGKNILISQIRKQNTAKASEISKLKEEINSLKERKPSIGRLMKKSSYKLIERGTDCLGRSYAKRNRRS